MDKLIIEDMENNIREIFFPKAEKFCFKPGQESAIRTILGGSDLFVQLPTAGGKTLCYMYPAVMLPGITIVISPLVRLMYDQVEYFNRTMKKAPEPYRNFKAIVMRHEDEYSVRSKKKSVLSDINVKMIYMSPEKINSPGFLHFIGEVTKTRNISMVVCDEAHCISLWGWDFRKSYFRIPHLVDFLKTQQKVRPIVAAFTATATEAVKTDVISNLKLNIVNKDDEVDIQKDNLVVDIIETTDEERVDSVIEYITGNLESRKKSDNKCIIFCSTKNSVEMLRNSLIKNQTRLPRRDYMIAICHGGMSEDKKRENIEIFSQQNKTKADNGRYGANILVATKIVGMGMDIDNVDLVIHYDIPDTIEDYYQEIGRAGRREGVIAHAKLFYTEEDIKNKLAIMAATLDKIPKKDPTLEVYKRIISQYRLVKLIEMIRGAGGKEDINNYIYDQLKAYFSMSVSADKQLFQIYRAYREVTSEKRISTYLRGKWKKKTLEDIVLEVRKLYPKEIASKEYLGSFISMNVSKVAGLIRKGEYESGKEQIIPISNHYGSDIIIGPKKSGAYDFINTDKYTEVIYSSGDPLEFSENLRENINENRDKALIKCGSLEESDALFYELKKRYHVSMAYSRDIVLYSGIKRHIDRNVKGKIFLDCPEDLDDEKTFETLKNRIIRHLNKPIYIRCKGMSQVFKAYDTLNESLELKDINLRIKLKVRRVGSTSFIVTNAPDQDNINFFDMMVSDAIYTVAEFEKPGEEITINDILRCISGDPSYRAYVRNDELQSKNKNTSDDKNVWRQVINSVEKLKKTTIKIENTDNSMSNGLSKKKVWSGALLKVDTISEEGCLPRYRYLDKSPLYEYAEASHGQFYTINHEMLHPTSAGKKNRVPNSLMNLKLKYYLAYRLLLANPKFCRNSSDYFTRNRGNILNVSGDRETSLFNILGIDGYEDKKKRQFVYERISKILDIYKIYYEYLQLYNKNSLYFYHKKEVDDNGKPYFRLMFHPRKPKMIVGGKAEGEAEKEKEMEKETEKKAEE